MRCSLCAHTGPLAHRLSLSDNTNRDRKTRAHYIELAKERKVPIRSARGHGLTCSRGPLRLTRSLLAIRCFYFPPSTFSDLAQHQNFWRLYPSSPNVFAPAIASTTFSASYEQPSLDEGYSEEPKRLGFSGWTGDETDAKARARWEGWQTGLKARVSTKSGSAQANTG